MIWVRKSDVPTTNSLLGPLSLEWRVEPDGDRHWRWTIRWMFGRYPSMMSWDFGGSRHRPDPDMLTGRRRSQAKAEAEALAVLDRLRAIWMEREHYEMRRESLGITRRLPL